MMRRSHWITNHEENRSEHYLLAFNARTPPAMDDLLLAEKVGDLDPFVRATESGQDVRIHHISAALGAREFVARHEKTGT